MSRAALEGVAAIKSAVDSGATVYADTLAYRVIKDAIGQYLIHCTVNDSYIGLHGLEGTKYAETLNGSEFFTLTEALSDAS